MPRVLVPVTLAEIPAPCGAADRVHRLSGETMGTTWSVKLAAPPRLALAGVRREIERSLDLVIAQMSTWEPASDLSRFNRAPAGSWHALPGECLTVLDYALEIARDTGGAYDPTVGPLVDLWGFGPAPRRDTAPAAEAIASARARTGWIRVALDADRRRARQPGGVAVDLSSVAKGFAVDQVARRLTAMGLPSHLVEIGGELRGHGVKPDGSPWWVALERPPAAPGGPARPGDLVVALHGLSVATSGDYRRWFADDGTRYAHTIDPRTGWPVAHRLASVTVMHPECMQADALATAMAVLGAEAGLAYARARRLAALFVERGDAGLEERMTPAFAAMLA